MPKQKEIPSLVYDPSCVLYLPLWKRDGATFVSDDAMGHACTVTGATWGVQGRTFDGASTKIVSSSLPTAQTTNVSLFAWAKFTTASMKGCIAHNGAAAGNGNGFSIGVGSNDMDTNGNDLIGLLPTVAYLDFNIAIGTGWHFVGMTRDLTTWRGYVDGVVSGTTATNNPATPTTEFLIGKMADNGGQQKWWGDLVGEVSVYNRALSAAEIQQNYLETKWRYV